MSREIGPLRNSSIQRESVLQIVFLFHGFLTLQHHQSGNTINASTGHHAENGNSHPSPPTINTVERVQSMLPLMTIDRRTSPPSRAGLKHGETLSSLV